MISDVYERATFSLAVLIAVACLIGPLLVVATLEQPPDLGTVQRAGEVTVGIGVILRATFRRIFRAATRNFFRTSFSAVTRASARTFTRRLLRLSVRIMFGVIAKQVGDQKPEAPAESEDASRTLKNPRLSLISLGISFLALALSFWGVLWMASGNDAAAATTAQGLSILVACLLAATPILLYGTVTYLLASWLKAEIRFACELDALLLQAYFTGAGSFLPMTTDVEYYGSKRQKATLAASTIAAIYLCHLAILGVARATDWYPAEFVSSILLIYAFVYSFPIAPLEGFEVWAQSKLLWLALFLPILISFFVSFPAVLAPLL